MAALEGVDVIRVIVADDNAVVRQGLTAVLSMTADIDVVAEAATGREAIGLTAAHDPDVVLLDVRMPVMDGIAAAAVLADRTQVLMLTYSDEPETVGRAIRAGAAGYLVHGQFDASELATSVRHAREGQTVVSPSAVTAMMDALRADPSELEPERDTHSLTCREIEVMDRIAQGHSNSDVAAELFLSEKTVKNHINRIYTKMDVRTRAQAVACWLGSPSTTA